MDLNMSIKRADSASCLLLLDCEADTSDVFDPPAWRPGRYLQFADITSAEDEASVRPVSLPTGRLPGPGVTDHTGDGAVDTHTELVSMDLVQLGSRRPVWRNGLMARQTTVLLTGCMAVALAALGLLSFIL